MFFTMRLSHHLPAPSARPMEMTLLKYRLFGRPRPLYIDRRLCVNFLRFVFVVLLALSIVTEASAGDFTVTPVRLHFGLNDRAIAVTFTNDGDNPLTIQADIFEWRQDADGKDVLTPTEDIFLSPPIATIPPNSRQVLRMARLNDGPPLSNEPSTYRMIVREIPETTVEKNLTVKISLAFSLPIFVAQREPKRRLNCQVKHLPPNSFRTTCENKGNIHALITHLTLATPTGDTLIDQDIGGGYLLPGVMRNFDVKRQGGPLPAGHARLEVLLDDMSREHYDISLDN